MARKTDAELLTDAGRIKNETAAAANTAVRVGEMLENIIDSKGANYAVYSGLLTQNGESNVITLGTPTALIVGVTYYISVLEFGDDFTNVGAVTNTVGERFIATGTTPIQWTFSELLYDEATPEILLFQNELNTPLYWEYKNEGVYWLKSPDGIFDDTKTMAFLQATNGNTPASIGIWYRVLNVNTIEVQVIMNGTGNVNSYLIGSPIEIRIYQ
ncbi:hypothetical protein UFOVP217_31 [uncultured Caudovirales phage]|uniref:Uncharacterized protein n=1 Tax=uncultured Caudovirales phage TaxID=2100421 RepID=A0A6J7WL28_9CAUD|nr:hypothetical protein UFOVP217_31 [uncultured Caudovirales phage]